MARFPRRDDDDEDDEAMADDGQARETTDKSKSQVKRELLALDPLTEQLLLLPERQLAGLGLSEGLLGALHTARGLKRGALKRQLRYARGLLAQQDHLGVAAALAALAQPSRDQINALHELEDWRERLIAGDSLLLDTLLKRYPELDRQQLLQLLRNAKAERAAAKTPRAARALFQLLSTMRGTDQAS